MDKKKAHAFTRTSLARAAGIGAETLRFYEQKNLVKAPERNASGYRIYGQDDLDRLQFIQRAKGLGFSLDEIRELMTLTGNIRTPRRKVRQFAKARLQAIRQKIEALNAMEQALGALIGKCDGKGPLKGCPIAEFVGNKNHQAKGGCHEG
ncbi:MAG: heavy metal-responsive transcriptional regulator [Akkermansiaceae bacterium]|nr:heavy metal-responsive transcriptional regulator [Akkermansiaceae bacterium]